MNPDQYKIFPFPDPPRTQCLSTRTFKQPPLDGSLTGPELYDWHLNNSPDHPLFVYADENHDAKVIYWPEGVRAMHRVGRTVQTLAQDITVARPVFGILATSDIITYFTMIAGILRAGCIVFPISPRNSAAAVAHLLSKTSTFHVFVGSEPSLQELAASSLKILADCGKSLAELPNLSTIPTFEEIYQDSAEEPFKPLPPYRPGWDDAAIVMHSSGSTAFPKPIVWSHYRYSTLGFVPYLGERDMCGQRLACHSMPMYHGMGIMQTMWTAACGLVITAFKPQIPAIAPTPQSVLSGSIATRSDVIFCVPSFVEAWAKDPDQVRLLQQTKGVLYGGGPLSQAVGDELTDKGISIFILYGCSECGIMSPILPTKSSKDWNYFKFPEGIETRFLPDENGNAELLLLPGKYMIPNVLNTTIDGLAAYATNDILSPHPTMPGYWNIFGRTDDQIMHSTGEKTNPGPLENILNQDAYVRAAVMFGRGRFYAGVIVDPRPEFEFNPADERKLVEFRNKIWPTVERINEYAPQHSRLFKEMILVAKPSKPFTYTAKNTPRRQAVIDDYEPEIDNLYATVDETAQTDLAPPLTWNLASATAFVRGVVERVVQQPLRDDDDIFLHGCDSLQATWIRNSVLRALRETTRLNTRAVPGSFVYQHPTVRALGAFIAALTSSENPEADADTLGLQEDSDKRVREMLTMVERYSTNWPVHAPGSASRLENSGVAGKGDIVLLTGTTGGLGASLLSVLVSSPAVKRVYAVNRRARSVSKSSSRTLLARQVEALRVRGLDERVATSFKVVLVEIDLAEERMGVEVQVFEEMRDSVTHIIHNAWPVNFNLSLQSFEPNVRHVKDLINLALSSPRPTPPRLIFISSVGILERTDTSKPAPEAAVSASIAVGSGYSESKWVAEALLSAAARHTALRPASVRVGQLSGGASGAWNVNEWFPALVRSSAHLGVLPGLDKDVSWLSVDAAAAAIAQLRDETGGEADLYLHLAHPRPVPWSRVAGALSHALGLPVVPYDEWYARLARSGQGRGPVHKPTPDDEVAILKTNPALKILEFFAGEKRSAGTAEPMGIPRMDVTRAQAGSSVLETLPALGEEDVYAWVVYWKQVGFLPA